MRDFFRNSVFEELKFAVPNSYYVIIMLCMIIVLYISKLFRFVRSLSIQSNLFSVVVPLFSNAEYMHDQISSQYIEARNDWKMHARCVKFFISLTMVLGVLNTIVTNAIFAI